MKRVCPLLALNEHFIISHLMSLSGGKAGHAVLHCICLLLTQSGHRHSLHWFLPVRSSAYSFGGVTCAGANLSGCWRVQLLPDLAGSSLSRRRKCIDLAVSTRLRR